MTSTTIQSLYRGARARIAALIGRHGPIYPPDEPFVPPPERPAAELISELGLIEDSVVPRAHPDWCPPTRVLITGACPTLLTWLNETVPTLQLIAIHGAEDGLTKVDEADAIIGWFTPEMIARGRRLRWLQIHTSGVESVLGIRNIATRGIVVTNLQRTAAPTLAEHAFGMLLALTRKLALYAERQRRGRWAQFEIRPAQLGTLRGKTLLVAGLGGIGTEVARLGSAFGMTVLAVRSRSGDRPAFVSEVASASMLPALLRRADIVVNALPLTPTTVGLFNASLFCMMKPNAIFMNIARGASVVTDDLTLALQKRTIAAAALDVVDPEPLPPTHPLWRMSNVLITPHVAGLSQDSSDRSWLVIRENLRRFAIGGALLSVVRVERGY